MVFGDSAGAPIERALLRTMQARIDELKALLGCLYWFWAVKGSAYAIPNAISDTAPLHEGRAASFTTDTRLTELVMIISPPVWSSILKPA